jgi:hypothetical protein
MATAELEGPIEGQPFLMAGGFDLAKSGYLGEEYFLSGVAQSYAQQGERGTDGRWSARPDARAQYATRIVVRRPQNPARFNGTVLVEWLNVSGGLDACPDWMFTHRHLMREGAAWVGVSAQKAGIDGGGLVPGMPLKQADAERYGGLVHPGDAFAFDIYSQVAHALRDPDTSFFGAGEVERVIAIGESQSAGFLVTYVNAIDSLAHAYDAFVIHGRPGKAAAIEGAYLRQASDGEGITGAPRHILGGDLVRADLRVPVLVLQSETDVVSLGSGRARQPDGELFRLWEIAGAAHFDTCGLMVSQQDDGSLPIEQLAELLAASASPGGLSANSPINAGPQQHYIAQAALAQIERQLREGIPMPRAPRLETLDEAGSQLARDELGIARGGIRTPWVDVPSAVLSGEGQGGGDFMFLFGTTNELDAATLERLYPGGPDEHRARFEACLDEVLKQEFILSADADEIRALARHGRQPSGFSLPS